MQVVHLIFFFSRERDWGGEGQRARERENVKQVPRPAWN